eukprot:TRINITY_DN8536_c0_g1_i1.p1 TRINITY_DN8536_c0_g1~~TRINITY_DN8536_c0_g1_i1.p1  ORF type:complete len:206 (-),score=45.66 TRINITY_DN8536_c0_g1_i1:138-755(-)
MADQQQSKRFIVLVSGKRFSGKDFISSLLASRLQLKGISSTVTHLADGLKKVFAAHANLDLHRLLTDREFKESHREEMTNFYLQTQKENKHRWCTQLWEDFQQSSSTAFIISDLRHQFEVDFFKQKEKEQGENPEGFPFTLLLVRIDSKESTREKRGWQKTATDLDTTEIDLDQFSGWSLKYDNDESNKEKVIEFLESGLIPLIK